MQNVLTHQAEMGTSKTLFYTMSTHPGAQKLSFKVSSAPF